MPNQAHWFFRSTISYTIGEAKKTCIMIGDSLTSDMKGAQNAELTSVWFMPAGDIAGAMGEYDIDYTASDFDELFDVLSSRIHN